MTGLMYRVIGCQLVQNPELFPVPLMLKLPSTSRDLSSYSCTPNTLNTMKILNILEVWASELHFSILVIVCMCILNLPKGFF